MQINELFGQPSSKVTVWKKRSGSTEKVRAPSSFLTPRHKLVSVNSK
jgi:hypothetical protein